MILKTVLTEVKTMIGPIQGWANAYLVIGRSRTSETRVDIVEKA